MKPRMMIIPAAVLATMALGSSTARADEHRGQDRGRSESAHRAETPRAVVGHASPRTYEAPHANVVPPPAAARSFGGHYDAHYAPHYAPHYDAHYHGPYYYAPHYHAYYHGPVYAAPAWGWFHPHFSIGFGVYLGYPVAYPYSYPYPAPAPAYGYPAPAATVAPGMAYGGVTFQITPAEATVYVDGNPVGQAGSFYDPQHPLTLAAGSHQIEVVADGYQPLTFQANIVAGQVIPYQGTLQAN